MVGHSVISVPVTVSPTKPSRFTASWASCTRACHVPGRASETAERASSVPSTAPTGSSQAAIT